MSRSLLVVLFAIGIPAHLVAQDARSLREGQTLSGTLVSDSEHDFTIRLDEDVLGYFKALSEETEIPYQTLINLYLRDCAQTRKRPSMRWRKTG